MAERRAATQSDLEDVLRRLESAREQLIETLTSMDGALFDRPSADGESIKTALERAADDINFYYGRLAARMLNLPQPPCLLKAEFMSLREATLSLQVAHRRFSNLLHDLVPTDLARSTEGDEHEKYTLRQVLELATAHYRLRQQQVRALAKTAGPRRNRHK